MGRGTIWGTSNHVLCDLNEEYETAESIVQWSTVLAAAAAAAGIKRGGKKIRKEKSWDNSSRTCAALNSPFFI